MVSEKGYVYSGQHKKPNCSTNNKHLIKKNWQVNEKMIVIAPQNFNKKLKFTFRGYGIWRRAYMHISVLIVSSGGCIAEFRRWRVRVRSFELPFLKIWNIFLNFWSSLLLSYSFGIILLKIDTVPFLGCLVTI